jgi:hypothetical protein
MHQHIEVVDGDGRALWRYFVRVAMLINLNYTYFIRSNLRVPLLLMIPCALAFRVAARSCCVI